MTLILASAASTPFSCSASDSSADIKYVASRRASARMAPVVTSPHAATEAELSSARECASRLRRYAAKRRTFRTHTAD